MLKYHKETHQESANQPAEAPAEAESPGEEDGDPKQHNCGKNRGKRKLFGLERPVKEKEIQLAAAARTLGPTNTRRTANGLTLA
jgi:hypothetical protein